MGSNSVYVGFIGIVFKRDVVIIFFFCGGIYFVKKFIWKFVM